MIIIVDGYNILKQARGVYANELEKQAFVSEVAQYARHKKHQVLLVFDGGYSTYPERERREYITVIHAGTHQTADDYIKKLLGEMQGKDVLLASSDNELCFFAYNRGMASIDAMAFFSLLGGKSVTQPESANGGLKKFVTASSNKELEELMEQETQRIPLKKEDIAQKRERGRQVAKHEKVLLKKIKKL